MIAIVVEHCASCPFCLDRDDGSPWLCDAHQDAAPVPREIPEQRTGKTWPPPPDWCPLREADRLVTLRRTAV